MVAADDITHIASSDQIPPENPPNLLRRIFQPSQKTKAILSLLVLTIALPMLVLSTQYQKIWFQKAASPCGNTYPCPSPTLLPSPPIAGQVETTLALQPQNGTVAPGQQLGVEIMMSPSRTPVKISTVQIYLNYPYFGSSPEFNPVDASPNTPGIQITPGNIPFDQILVNQVTVDSAKRLVTVGFVAYNTNGYLVSGSTIVAKLALTGASVGKTTLTFDGNLTKVISKDNGANVLRIPTESFGIAVVPATPAPLPTTVSTPVPATVDCSLYTPKWAITSISGYKEPGSGNYGLYIYGNFPHMQECGRRTWSLVYGFKGAYGNEEKSYYYFAPSDTRNQVGSISDSLIVLKPVYQYSPAPYTFWVLYCTGSQSPGDCGPTGGWSYTTKTVDFTNLSTPFPTTPSPIPFVTPTPIASSTPSGQIISIRAMFQGITPNSRRTPKNVSLTVQTSAVQNSFPLTLTSDTNGLYSYSGPFVNLTSGTYNFVLKGPAHLARVFRNVQVVSSGRILLDATNPPLKAGDIAGLHGDPDNMVDASDLGLLISRFNPASPAPISQTWDLNDDGVIDISDIALLITNFNPGVYGDQL